MRSIDPWTHAVRWPISGTAMNSVSEKKEGGKKVLDSRYSSSFRLARYGISGSE